MAVYPLQSSNVFSYTFLGQLGQGNSYLYASNNNPIFNIGGQSWTIECWIKPVGIGYTGSYATIFSKRIGATGTSSYFGYIQASTGLVGFYNGTEYPSIARLPSNTWNHVAWVFNQGANVRIFVNGSNALTTTAVTSVVNNEARFYIGKNDSESNQFNGDISNFRITLGQALYTGNFDVSHYPMQLPNNAIGPHVGTTNVAASLTGNIILLTCNDMLIKSNGNTLINGAFTNSGISAFGDVYPHLVHSEDFEEFSYTNIVDSYAQANSGSPGPNTSAPGFIVTADTTAFNRPSGDFTLECFVYVVAGRGFILNKGGAPNVAWQSFSFSYDANDNVYFGGSNTNARIDIGSDSFNGVGGNVLRGYMGTTAKNTWVHLAVTRSGSTYYGFVNGVLGYTETTANTPYNSTGRGLQILGQIQNLANSWTAGGTTGSSIAGYITNIRFTQAALYTSNFTPLSRPLSIHANTQFLTRGPTLFDYVNTTGLPLSVNGAGTINISKFTPFARANTVANANSSTGLSTQGPATGQELGRIYNKFNYNFYAAGAPSLLFATGQELGRIYNKFDYNFFATTISASTRAYTVGNELGRIYNKFNYSLYAATVPFRIYTVGNELGRIRSKINDIFYGYLSAVPPVNYGATPNTDFEFWS